MVAVLNHQTLGEHHENNRKRKIRVTVSDERYEYFRSTVRQSELKQTLPSGDVRYHDVDGIIRGRILSHAMKILGNRNEAEQLDSEPFEISSDELHKITRNILIGQWLESHSKYAPGETIQRYLNGLRLTTGMELEIEAAAAYASSAIGNLDYQALYNETLANYSHTRQEQIFRAARAGRKSSNIDADLAEVVYWKKYMHDLERQYRHRYDNSDFQIEILNPNNMPAQIGLCRYREQQNRHE